jgi:hypothetical protein
VGESRLSERRIENSIPVTTLMDDHSELAGAADAPGTRPFFDPGRMRVAHEHFFGRIEETPIETEPFPHIYVRDVFQADFYAHLLTQLPSDDRYVAFPPPYESRLSINLERETAAELGPFWQAFEAWINGQDFLDGMVRKFAEFLPLMHDYRAPIARANASGGSVSIRAQTILNRDYANFALGPHTGGLSKFIVAILYLASDARFADFGTSIYRPKEPAFITWDSTVYPHEKFRLVRTFPNLPNSMFIFVKTHNSFHGVEPGRYSNDGRNLLMWIPKISASKRASAHLTVPLKVMTG